MNRTTLSMPSVFQTISESSAATIMKIQHAISNFFSTPSGNLIDGNHFLFMESLIFAGLATNLSNDFSSQPIPKAMIIPSNAAVSIWLSGIID